MGWRMVAIISKLLDFRDCKGYACKNLVAISSVYAEQLIAHTLDTISWLPFSMSEPRSAIRILIIIISIIIIIIIGAFGFGPNTEAAAAAAASSSRPVPSHLIWWRWICLKETWKPSAIWPVSHFHGSGSHLAVNNVFFLFYILFWNLGIITTGEQSQFSVLNSQFPVPSSLLMSHDRFNGKSQQLYIICIAIITLSDQVISDFILCQPERRKKVGGFPIFGNVQRA